MNREKTKQRIKAVRFFAGALVVLIFFTVMIWGFQTSWGDVTIKRIYVTGDDGTTISALVYIPKSATNETPAEAVMIFHGRSNQAHSNDTWSLELARRGYVVISPDLSGGGHSDVNDRSAQAIALAEQVITWDFINSDNLTLIGYSAGCGTTVKVAQALPDNVSNIVNVMSPSLINLPDTDETFNYCIIKGQADQYNWEFVGDVEDCAEYVTETFGLSETVEYGVDYETSLGTLRYCLVTDFSLHQTANVSRQAIEYIVDYVTYINPTSANAISNTNMVWGWQQLFSACASVNMMFLLAALINLLMQFPFFETASNTVTLRAPQRGAKAWILDVVFTIVIPAVLFIHVSAYFMSWTAEGTVLGKVMRSTNLNGIMGWLIVVAIIGVVRMIIAARKRKKAGIVSNMSTFALGSETETKINWSRPAKGLLIGIICAAFTLVWLSVIEGFLGVNYQIWNLATYVAINPARFVRAIPYIIIIFAVMLIGNMNIRVLPSTGNERRDMWIAVAVNTVMTSAALMILLVIQYGGNLIIGTGQAVFEQMSLPGVKGTSVGALDFAFGYCYMMGGTSGVVTYIYRKYGNIWVGVIPAAIFAGLITTSAFTMVA